MTLEPGTRLGAYEIQSALGAGGMGEVYKARDVRLDRTVAIKILSPSLAADPQFRARFEREARAISQLDHPNICALHDVGTHDDVAYLVMQYLDGETLAARLERGPLPLDEALAFGFQIADALGKAHRAGIVHRDLKPGNIMLTRSGARLLDFGLAKSSGLSGSAGEPTALPTVPAPVTAQGTILGTFQYMAPEQIEGADADPRADIWALGCVLYEMVAGTRAFNGKSHASLVGAILKDEPPPLSTRQPIAPPALDHVVQQCLAKHPDERWQSAGDVAAELRWIATNPAPARHDGTQAKGLRLWRTASLLLVGLTGALIALWTFYRPRLPPPPTFMLSVAPPVGTTFATTGSVVGLPWFALSPDGRDLTFVAMSPDGREQLWVRPLASTSARPLAGTDGARAPFWSADGRYIAFFANGGLHYLEPAAGSPPQRLADAQGVGFGGAWNRQNIILFGSQRQGVRRIRFGEPASDTSLTHVDASRGEFAHGWPQFLPDERHFVFTVTKPGTPSANDVWIGSVDGESPRRLTGSTSSAKFAAPGWLLYTGGGDTSDGKLRRGNLLAQRFDPALLRLIGEPIELAKDVGANGPSGYAAVSVSSAGVLVYGVPPDIDSHVTWRDRTGRIVEPLDLPHTAAPALSRDGRMLALERWLPQSGRSVWTYDLRRRIAQRVVFDHSLAPQWSPDGAHIVFTGRRHGRLDQLFRRALPSTAPEELLSDAIGSFATDWTPDGRFIIFQGPSGGADIQTIDTADLKKTTLAGTGSGIYGAVSPDGRWLAYSSAKSGRMEVYVRAFPAGGQEWLVSRGGAEPRWRADGRELFYIGSDRHLVAVPIRSGPTFDPGEPQRLFELNVEDLSVPYGTRRYAPAPDGQSFFIAELTGRRGPLPLTVIVNWTTLVPDRQ